MYNEIESNSPSVPKKQGFDNDREGDLLTESNDLQETETEENNNIESNNEDENGIPPEQNEFNKEREEKALKDRSADFSRRIELIEHKNPSQYTTLTIEDDVLKKMPDCIAKIDKFSEMFAQVDELNNKAEDLLQSYLEADGNKDEDATKLKVTETFDKLEQEIIKLEIFVNKNPDFEKLKKMYEQREKEIEDFLNNFQTLIINEDLACDRIEKSLDRRSLFISFADNIENREVFGELDSSILQAVDVYKELKKISNQANETTKNLVQSLGIGSIAHINEVASDFDLKYNPNKLSKNEVRNFIRREKGYLSENYLADLSKKLAEFNQLTVEAEAIIKKQEKSKNNEQYIIIRSRALEINKKYKQEIKFYLKNPDNYSEEENEAWRVFQRIIKEKKDFGVIKDDLGNEALSVVEEMLQSIGSEREDIRNQIMLEKRQRELDKITEEAEQLIESVKNTSDLSPTAKSKYSNSIKTLREKILGVKASIGVEPALASLSDVLENYPDDLQKIISAKNVLEQSIKKEW